MVRDRSPELLPGSTEVEGSPGCCMCMHISQALSVRETSSRWRRQQNQLRAASARRQKSLCPARCTDAEPFNTVPVDVGKKVVLTRYRIRVGSRTVKRTEQGGVEDREAKRSGDGHNNREEQTNHYYQPQPQVSKPNPRPPHTSSREPLYAGRHEPNPNNRAQLRAGGGTVVGIAGWWDPGPDSYYIHTTRGRPGQGLARGSAG